MWHKAEWMGHSTKLERTHVGLLVKLANHYTTKGAKVVLTETLIIRVAQNQVKLN